MATDWDDDVDDIVVDDKPREDGLIGEGDAAAEPVPRSTLTELEQIVTAIPRILDRLDELAEQRSESDSAIESRVSKAFNDLTNRLGALADQQSESGRTVEHRVSKSFTVLKNRLDELMERVGGLEERLDDYSSLASASQVDDGEPAASEDVDSSAAMEAVVSELVDSRFTPPGEEQLIEQLVFGKDLCEERSLDGDRRALLDGVLAREATAIGLAARLMLVRAAGAEELPPLLKEIGEAYYRRYPRTTDVTDALESSLVKDLARRIAAVGLRNSIELILPGDRYDATRHVSPDRGVVVAEVRGWAVLRDNGKPLTKASVGLR